MSRFLVIQLALYSKAWSEIPVKTVGDLKTAWEKGYDFQLTNGVACSNRDIDAMKADGIEGVIINAGGGKNIQVKFD